MEHGKPFIKLDSSVLDNEHIDDAIKEDIAQNRIEYIFPEGFSDVPLIEECRALEHLDDFDTVYNLAMKMLEGKPVEIFLKDLQGKRHQVAKFIVVSKDMDLRSVDFFLKYPITVNWMLRFIVGYLQKKYPRLSLDMPQ